MQKDNCHKISMKVLKSLDDFKHITWNCRFHPFNGWHEAGCPHREWTKEQLQDALNLAKQSNAYLIYLLTHKGGE